MIKDLKLKIKLRIDRYLYNYYNNVLKKNTTLLNNKVGNNVVIEDQCIIVNSVFADNIKISRESIFYNVIYGSYSYNSIRVTVNNCIIGKFCSIAQGVSIGLGKHPINEFVSTHPAFYSIHKQCGYTFSEKQMFNEVETTVIGNDVWIGANSIIADGVNIGNGAVIAANSFVNKDVPDFGIVGGTPAKLIKYRFSQSEIEFLLKLCWWDKETEWLKENRMQMLDIKLLFQKFNDNH